MPAPHKPRSSDTDRAEIPRAACDTSASPSPYSIGDQGGYPTPGSDSYESYSEPSPAPARERASPAPAAGRNLPSAQAAGDGPPSLPSIQLSHAQLQERAEAEAVAAVAREPEVTGAAHSPSPSSPEVEGSVDYSPEDSAPR